MIRYQGLNIGFRVLKMDGLTEQVLDPKPSQKAYNHSQEFSWGYSGSGPAQLALALLLDATGNQEKAVKYHQAFKESFVAAWPQHTGWGITKDQILDWLAVKVEHERS